MASTFQVLFDGTPADLDFYTPLVSVEVEENADLPGAVQVQVPVSRTADGDLTNVSDDRFKPLANLAVIATAEGKGDQCIFDGYVLAHKLHLERGATQATLTVWGQDASWLMNLEEKAREWADVTDAQVAAAVFGDYSITPADDNSADASASHPESGQTLMQRASDIQFLRLLARRNGKWCRVACKDKPGKCTGYFAKPKLSGDPVLTLSPNDPIAWNVEALDFEWDVMRPTKVTARQALFTDSSRDGVGGDTTDPGLAPLDARGLADFAGKPMSVLLAAPVDDAGELTMRAQSLLREAGWFARCEGEADLARLQTVLRVGDLVAVEGAGSLHSGKYLVWSVRHTITGQAHKMKFVLVRNAVGPAPAGAGGGLLAGLL
jgi:phage protein D